MRKLIYAINMTVDGCCDHTKVGADDEIVEYYARLVRDIDVFLYGRITYQLMVPFWPDIAKNPAGQTKPFTSFAQAFDSVGKIVVFSRSLAGTEEEKTRIVRANLRDEVLKLKQQRGKDILVGGLNLPSQLVELGLIDEYRFVVHPIVAGEGRRLFTGVNLPERLQLKLVDSFTTKSGCTGLRYLKQ